MQVSSMSQVCGGEWKETKLEEKRREKKYENFLDQLRMEVGEGGMGVMRDNSFLIVLNERL
jgi:hypothetical protein